MSKYSIEDTTLTNIADAIRSKTGDSATLTPSEMVSAIEGIETGGGDLSEYFKTSDFKDYTTGQYLWSQALLKMPPLDLTGVTILSHAFNGYQGIVPQMDTSQVTDFSSMFYNAYHIKEIPQFDTSSGTNFSYMFYSCQTITSIPYLNTSLGTNFQSMFYGCKKLETIPEIDTSQGKSCYQMFRNCSGLISVPDLNMSNSNDVRNMFTGCSALADFGGLKDLGIAYTQKTANYTYYKLDLSPCTALTYDSLMSVINNLYDLNLTYDVANGGTLYSQQLVLGSTNLAKLTEEEIAIATNKGWVVS